MLNFSFELLPGSDRLTPVHRLAGQQQDNLCGPYWVAQLLKAFGGADLSPEAVALLAGTHLPPGEGIWVPSGASPRQDYSRSLPLAETTEASGTSAAGLIRAASVASDGRFVLVPLQADWSAAQVKALPKLCQENPHWEAIPLANVQSGNLWGSKLSFADAVAYLQGENIQPPAADWRVGHFLTLAGTIKGEKTLFLVRDTYPIFGWNGYYLQSAAAIAAALNRNDGCEGGVLLFSAAQHQGEIEQQAQAQGFQVKVWDNGTPV